MKNFKKEKGITLVALIITIVVLLILAVVAIGAVQDSNIIAHAQNAATSYNQAKTNEINLLTKYEEKIEEVLSKEKVYRYMEDNLVAYIKLTVDKQIILDFPDMEVSGKYEYDNITSEVIRQNILDGMPTDVESYSWRAVKGIIDGDEGILLLSKDEKILYCNGIPFILINGTEDNENIPNEPQQSEWTTYGTEQMYFLVGTDKAYAILQGNLFVTYTIETGTLEGSEEFKNYTIPSHVMGASKVLKNGENIAAVIMPNGDFYTVGIGMNVIQTEKILASVIDYSSILEQIQ